MLLGRFVLGPSLLSQLASVAVNGAYLLISPLWCSPWCVQQSEHQTHVSLSLFRVLSVCSRTDAPGHHAAASHWLVITTLTDQEQSV